jgi:glyoxylase-like metal-dependent hydrolase (beta-lactamase superfamily II)
MSTGQVLSQVSQVAPAVSRLSGGVTNFYLIEQGGKLTVVDAGTPADWGLLLRALAAHGKVLGDVDARLLTHAHADHTGFAEQARTQAGTRVWVHQADAEVAKGAKPGKNDAGMTRYLLRAEFYRTVLSLMRRGGAKIVPVLEVSVLADGETLDVPGRPRAVHAPGHTPGNAALFLEEQRVLFSGDTIVTRNPLTGRTGPQIMPSGFNQDTPAALQSLGTLLGLAADTVLPGHGEPWTGGAAEAVRMAQAAGPSLTRREPLGTAHDGCT